MNSALCIRLGIEFPLFAFSRCRDVVAAVTNGGGIGMLGAVSLPPEALDDEIACIDAHLCGWRCGVDRIVPENLESKGQEVSDAALLAMGPQGHKNLANTILQGHGVGIDDLNTDRARHLFLRDNLAV